MSATATAIPGTETKFISDLTPEERKSGIHFDQSVFFSHGKGRKKRDVEGKLKGSLGGLILIDKNLVRHELPPDRVAVTLRDPLKKGDKVRAFYPSPAYNQVGGGLIEITQTNTPAWKGKTEEGEEIEFDPFFFYKSPQSGATTEKVAKPDPPPPLDYKVDDRIKNKLTNQTGEIVSTEKNLEPFVEVRWDGEEETSLINPIAIPFSKLPMPAPAEHSSNDLKLGSKVRRAKGEPSDEIGEIVEYNNVNGKWRVQWQNRRAWHQAKSLILVTDANSPDANADSNSKDSAPEIEIGAICTGTGKKGEGPAKVVKLPRGGDGKIQVEWFGGNWEWMTPESLEFSGEKSFIFLPLIDIKLNGGTQPRAQLNNSVIEDYAELYKEGKYEALPPLTVFYDGDSYWLADGFHRAAALELAGMPGVRAEIRQGTRRDAQLYSFGVNAEHGLRRSLPDKRRAVLAMLKDLEWRKWSNRAIAKQCKVSDKYVGKIRKEIYPKEEITERIFIDKHGKETVMATDNIGKSKPEAIERAAAPEPAPEPEIMPEPEPEPEAEPEPEPEPEDEAKPKSAQMTSMTTPEAEEPEEPEEPDTEITPEPEPGIMPETVPTLSAEDEESERVAALAKRKEAEKTAEKYWEKIMDIKGESIEVKKAFRSILAMRLTESYDY